jgi:hypothetical protein
MMSYMGRHRAPAKAGGRGRSDAMDLGGFNWTLLTIVGAAALAVIIAWAALRNRASQRRVEDSEEATRRLYEEEEREHHGESDHVP